MIKHVYFDMFLVGVVMGCGHLLASFLRFCWIVDPKVGLGFKLLYSPAFLIPPSNLTSYRTELLEPGLIQSIAPESD